MVNIIWGLLLIIGVSFGLISGNSVGINKEILESAKKGINIIMEIIPILVIWMGLMKIAEDSGLLEKIANLLKRPLKLLFPSIPSGHKSLGLITSNMVANMMGLGNAATPFGLKAMEELQKLNKKKDTASDSMITFLVLNTSGITIIPTTVIALRVLHKSASPTEIVLATIIATLIGCICGLLLDYLFRRKKWKK